MSITRDQINTAMTRFLDRGGSIRRYEEDCRRTNFGK